MKEEQINHIRQKFSTMESDKDFVDLLNVANEYLIGPAVTPLTLNTLLHYSDDAFLESRYTVFNIKKKSGGNRRIMAPGEELKSILQCLNYVLQCIHEPHESAMGFTPGRSIVTNAKLHINKRFVYNIDLKDFFHSFSKERVNLAFINSPFNLSGSKEPIANLISKLCTHSIRLKKFSKTVLPQGSPTSPIISNILCHDLDNSLMQLAKEHDATYSRYADDITFSSQNNVFETRSFLWGLKKIIEGDYNLLINPQKTRLQKKNYRQEATGLIINEKPNVRRKFIKQVRMWFYYWEKYGIDRAQELFLRDYNLEKGHIKNGRASLVNVLDGKLHFLKMVKGDEDLTYVKLLKRFKRLQPLNWESYTKNVKPRKSKFHIIRIGGERKYEYSTLASKLNRGLFFLDKDGNVITKPFTREVNEQWRKAINRFKQEGFSSLKLVALYKHKNQNTILSWSNEQHHLLHVNAENVVGNFDTSFGLAIENPDNPDERIVLYDPRKPSAYKFSKEIVEDIRNALKAISPENTDYIDATLAPSTQAEKELTGIKSITAVAKLLLDETTFDKSKLEIIRRDVMTKVFGAKVIGSDGKVLEYIDYNQYLKDILNYEESFAQWENAFVNWYNASPENRDLTTAPSIADYFNLSTVEYDINNKDVEGNYNPNVSLLDNPYPITEVEDPRTGEVLQFKNLTFENEKWYAEDFDGNFIEVTRQLPISFRNQMSKLHGTATYTVSQIVRYDGKITYEAIYIGKDNMDGSELFNDLMTQAESLRDETGQIHNIVELSKYITEKYNFQIDFKDRVNPSYKFKFFPKDSDSLSFTLSFGAKPTNFYSITVRKDSPVIEIVKKNDKDQVMESPEYKRIFPRISAMTVGTNPGGYSFIDYRKDVYSTRLVPAIKAPAPVSVDPEETIAPVTTSSPETKPELSVEEKPEIIENWGLDDGSFVNVHLDKIADLNEELANAEGSTYKPYERNAFQLSEGKAKLIPRVTRVIKNSNLSVKKLLERGVYTPDMFSR